MAIQRLPVRFAIDRAGLVGADGATHAGSFDVAFLSNLPGMVVMAAADDRTGPHGRHCGGAGRPALGIPLSAGRGHGVEMPERGVPLEIGRGRIVAEGARVAILSFGTRQFVRGAARPRIAGRARHRAHGRRCALCQAADRDLILRLARDHEALITVEEGAIGGFGSHVAQLLADEGVLDRGFKFRSMVLPDTFIDQASMEDMYAVAGMNAPQIEAKVLELLGVAIARRA